MSKRALALTLALAVATLANGFPQRGAWVKFSSREGRFSALFPAKPEHVTDDAGPYTNHTFAADDGWATYGVTYADLNAVPDDPRSALDGARDVMIMGNELVGETEIKLSGYAGRELKIKSAGGAALSVTRLYLVGQRIYNVTVIFAPANTYDAAGVAKFFASFKLAVKPAGSSVA